MNAVDMCTLIFIGVSLLLSIAMISWFCTFYRLRHIPQISSRSPNTSLLSGIACIIGISVTSPLVLLARNISFIEYIPYSLTFCYVMSFCTQIGLYHIFSFRAYMVYFDIKWNKAMEDSKWRLFIDPQETNWFLKHRRSFGSKKQVGIIFFSHWFFWLFLAIIALVANNDHTTGVASMATRNIAAFCALIPFVFDCVIYCKFPKFDDVWKINDEIKLTLRAELISFTLFLIVMVTLKAEPYSYQYLLGQVVVCIAYFVYAVVIFYLVFKEFGLPANPLKVDKYIRHIKASTNLSKGIQSGKQAGKQHKELNLKQVLQTKHGFNQFARHLTKEFCLENLLFIVESQQWLQSLAGKPSYAEIADIRVKITLPESAPKSTILQTDNTISDISEMDSSDGLPSFAEYLQAVKIFTKYIINAAYFCINISSQCRGELYHIFGFHDSLMNENEIVQMLRDNKMQKEALFHLFDDARRETFHLLNNPFHRYKRTNEYHQLNEKMSNSVDHKNKKRPLMLELKTMSVSAETTETTDVVFDVSTSH